MSLPALRINQMILDQLAVSERRILSLIVAVRKSLQTSDVFKGDLTAAVESALRRLVASQRVVEVGGIYSLVSPTRH